MTPEQIKELIEYLHVTYPKCFMRPPLPFAIGIHKQLWKEDLTKPSTPFNKKTLSVVLKYYINSKPYRDARNQGRVRVNLDGKLIYKEAKDQTDASDIKTVEKDEVTEHGE